MGEYIFGIIKKLTKKQELNTFIIFFRKFLILVDFHRVLDFINFLI